MDIDKMDFEENDSNNKKRLECERIEHLDKLHFERLRDAMIWILENIHYAPKEYKEYAGKLPDTYSMKSTHYPDG